MKNLFFAAIMLIPTAPCYAQEDPAAEVQNKIIGWTQAYLKNYNLDVYPVEKNNDIIAVNWKIIPVQITRNSSDGSSLAFNLNGNGIKPLKDTENSQDNVNLSLDFYYCHWVTIDTKFRTRGDRQVKTDYMYYAGLKPATYESDNSFKNADYLFQPYIGFDVPYTDIIPYYWNKLVKPVPRKNRPLKSQPVKAYFIYSFVSKIHREVDTNVDNRTELEVDYWMDLIDKSILDYKLNVYMDKDLVKRYQYYDLSILYPVIGKLELMIKWSRGALPPLFTQTDNLTYGVRYQFGAEGY